MSGKTPSARNRVFLLSPANSGGERARMILRDEARFGLAIRLRSGEATLGEVFAFVSGLYFRGKLAYATAFAAPPLGLSGAQVIAPGRGLVPAETRVTLEELRQMASVPIDMREERYHSALARDAAALAVQAGHTCDIVLLGSIATAKYVDPLLAVFGERLLFPADFVGRGDMSRGGLLLRCAREGRELDYIPVLGATRRGQRPPKLPKLR